MMPSPILWQSPDRSVTLIDIPRSISAAQGSDFAHHHLLSSPPLQSPFPSNEPKSASAKAKLNISTANHELHAEYKDLLQQAIDQIKKEHVGDWCLPRHFVEQPSRAGRKRNLQDSDVVSTDAGQVNLPEGYLFNIARTNVHATSSAQVLQPMNTQSEGRIDALIEDSKVLSTCNNSNQTANLNVTLDNDAGGLLFSIPPNASLCSGDCTLSKPFRDRVRRHAQEAGIRSEFDIILLDPPWPNRSVKRTHKTPGTTYTTAPSLEDIREVLLDTHLEILMENHCYVGIWITNKPAIRDLVVGENGIFDCWDVELVEEWIWLKTTVHGEPVTSLDGIWRKPYEVFLLGRRRPKDQDISKGQAPLPIVKRRVIIGVLDLHSRKPCLKTLIEPMMDKPTDYRALEVFARHLVAGWWSWGDECLKFNWEGYWRKDVEDQKT